MWIAFAIVGLGLLVLELVCIYYARRHAQRLRTIEEAVPSSIAGLAPGLAKVKGAVVPLPDTLNAPMTQRPCVYYRFKVEEKHTHAGPHGASSYWKKIINDAKMVPCGVDDGTAIALVNLAEAELLLTSGDTLKSGFGNDAPPDLERLLKNRYNKTSKGWVFNKTMRYNETRIEVGDTLFVVGVMEPTDGGHPQFVRDNYPLLVSHYPEEKLAANYRRYAFWCWVAAVTILLVGIGFAIFLSMMA